MGITVTSLICAINTSLRLYFRLVLAGPALGPPLLGIVYLLCQVAVLRSNSEKQRFDRCKRWLRVARSRLPNANSAHHRSDLFLCARSLDLGSARI
jgi:hypothetical protein